MISIENVQKQFGKLKALEGVSFDLDKPGVVAVLGPNGSGKTTVLKIILGMVLPQKGHIMLNGDAILGKWKYRSKMGYLPQIARFPENLTVFELIAMIRNLRGEAANEQELITMFGLEKFLNKKLSTLSGGTKQKVNIVLTFMFDSPLLILDEPTAGLDPVSLIRLKDLVAREKAKGKTLLITTHIMSLVEEVADEIIFLLEGRIHFQGRVESLYDQTAQPDLEHAIAKLLEDRV